MRAMIIHRFEELDSTQTWAKKHLETFDPGLVTVVIARSQTAGRGRLSRSFSSPPGGLYMTLCMQLDKSIQDLVSFALVVGLAIAKVSDKIRLKWPNDILIDGKKAGGILIETRAPWWMIGVGLNVTTDMAMLLVPDQPVTTFSKEGIESADLEGRILREIVSSIGPFLRHGFGPFQEEFEAKSAYAPGEVINVRTGEKKSSVIYRGVSLHGELMVEKEGEIIQFTQSEII